MLQSVCETKVVATSSPAEPKLVISSYGINIGMDRQVEDLTVHADGFPSGFGVVSSQLHVVIITL